MEFYPDASEEIPKDLPVEKGPRVRMMVFVEDYHAHDLVIRKSIIGILVKLINTVIRWISCCQKTLDTSHYGSELVDSRIATEFILDVGYMLW
jgi:hypothetical protein